MKKKEIIKNAFYLLNEVSDLKYQLELEKLENKKLRKQLSLYGVSNCFNRIDFYEHYTRSFNKKMDEIRDKFS